MEIINDKDIYTTHSLALDLSKMSEILLQNPAIILSETSVYFTFRVWRSTKAKEIFKTLFKMFFMQTPKIDSLRTVESSINLNKLTVDLRADVDGVVEKVMEKKTIDVPVYKLDELFIEGK